MKLRKRKASELDELLDDTRRLREELMKTSGSLEAFSEQLLSQIELLKRATEEADDE